MIRPLTLFSVLLLAASTWAPAQSSNGQPPPPPPKPSRVRTSLDGFDLSPDKKAKNLNQIGGASRGIGELTLYAPNAGKCYSGRPLFQWSVGGPGIKVDFVLKNETGAVVYQMTVESNHLLYPANAPELVPGATYSWTVKPQIDMMGSQSSPAQLVMVGGAERQELSSKLAAATASGPDPSPATAQIFVDNRIWYDAIADYTDLIARHPDSKELYRARGTVYDQLPQTQALASKDFATAGTL